MDKLRGKVLVVDDEQDLCDLLSKALSLEGYAVSTAASGSKALALLERESPDVIVLDLGLPVMSGIETLRRIRQRGHRSRVVILTARGTPASAREAMALGVREFIGKPFDVDRLLQVVADEIREGSGQPREE